jgi:hypothetical protein
MLTIKVERRFFCMLLLVLISLVSADQFTSPPNSLRDLEARFTIGQEYTITWESELSFINLYLRRWTGVPNDLIVAVLAREFLATPLFKRDNLADLNYRECAQPRNISMDSG